MWKKALLFGGAVLLFFLLLEGGARVLSLYQPREPAPAAPIEVVPATGTAVAPRDYGLNAGSLDSIHAPDQWVWWKVKANLSDYRVHIAWDETHGFTLNTDEQGFRKSGGSVAAGERILVVGDSTAFGVGVDDAQAWPAQLEAALGEKTQVVNAAVPGHSTFQALRMAEKYGMTPKPALVIVCAGFNDSALTPKGELPDLERAAKNERERAQGQPASEFLGLLSRAIEGAQRLAPQDERARLTPEEYRQTLDAARVHYLAMGIPLMWVRWPTQEETENNGAPSGGYPDVLLEHCGAEGVECVDLMQVFQALEPSPYYDFVHATAAGNAEAARMIAGRIQELRDEDQADERDGG